MKKILFLPLLRMQSGHHQVAEALMDMFPKHTDQFILKKIDLISYTNEALEKIITTSYLNWIRYAPGIYSFAYKTLFNAPPAKKHACKWYQSIFLKKMEQLVREENPDLIVCTHSFPSYLLSQLKMQGKCHVPVMNVYTDFFISNVWGKEGIDIHFIPSQEVKEQLMRNNYMAKKNLIVTGIPIHKEISGSASELKKERKPKILIAGGNSGLGSMLKVLQELKTVSQFDFVVLCGNNHKLYQTIKSWELTNIKALPYLSSRAEMNQVYDQVAAVVTKPGGVTVSEALRKRLPMFIHSVLPGQEQINLQFLKQQHLVFELNPKESLVKQLVRVLHDDQTMDRWHQAIDFYHKGIEVVESQKIVEVMEWLLDDELKDIHHA